MTATTLNQCRQEVFPDNIERYRNDTPLRLYMEADCIQCGSPFMAEPVEVPRGIDIDRLNYPLCFPCFMRLLLTGTVVGQQAVEKDLHRITPPAYHSTEFNKFDVSGPLAQHLIEIRNAVIGWTIQVVAYLRRPTATAPGNCLVFSESGPHGTGNGNGKTFLAQAASKYINRRFPRFRNPLSPGFEELYMLYPLWDMQKESELFLKSRTVLGPGNSPTYCWPRLDGNVDSFSFDDFYLRYAQEGVMFLDDVGRQPCWPMTAGLYERILDYRAEYKLPTLVTSNFGPDTLGEVIGTRAASRLLRNNCQIIELEAPEYALRSLQR